MSFNLLHSIKFNPLNEIKNYKGFYKGEVGL